MQLWFESSVNVIFYSLFCLQWPRLTL